MIAQSLAIGCDHHGSSHAVFRHSKAGRLSVPAHRPIKTVYIRLFLEFVDKAVQSDED